MRGKGLGEGWEGMGWHGGMVEWDGGGREKRDRMFLV